MISFKGNKFLSHAPKSIDNLNLSVSRPVFSPALKIVSLETSYGGSRITRATELLFIVGRKSKQSAFINVIGCSYSELCACLYSTCHHIFKNRYKNDSKEDKSKTSHKLLHTLRLTTVGIKKFSDKHCKTGTAS